MVYDGYISTYNWNCASKPGFPFSPWCHAVMPSGASRRRLKITYFVAVPRSCAISFRRNRNIAELGEKLRKIDNPYNPYTINGALVLMGTSRTNGGFSSKPCLMTLEGIVMIPSMMWKIFSSRTGGFPSGLKSWRWKPAGIYVGVLVHCKSMASQTLKSGFGSLHCNRSEMTLVVFVADRTEANHWRTRTRSGCSSGFVVICCNIFQLHHTIYIITSLCEIILPSCHFFLFNTANRYLWFATGRYIRFLLRLTRSWVRCFLSLGAEQIGKIRDLAALEVS